MTLRRVPEGEPTFLFTDIEGSTQLLQELGTQYTACLEAHHRIMREAIASTEGVEISTEGDAFFVAFDDPVAGVACALHAQRALASHSWPAAKEVRVRMGLHAGPVQMMGDDYVGLAVHVAARIASAAHGGQVIVSREMHDRVEGRLPAESSLLSLGEHRLKDLREPAELFQLAHPALPLEFAALRTLTVLPNNLPTQLTSFVGRQAEVDSVVALARTNRVVTLTGSGGVGKTRLALQTAAELGTEFPDGTWFADFAVLRDGSLLEQSIVAAMRIPNPAGRPDRELLVDHLAARRSLLVLDNCEHVIEHAATLVESLARACPALHVLVTSREPLGVPGEVVRRVPSMTVPRADDDVAELRDVEAFRLFVERATLVDPEFEVDDDDARAIAEICRRLDGIPMALELASARVNSLSCQQIADGLDDRFRLLSGGLRTALPRQQTLEALVDWSHDLLDRRERAVLRRLAVFAGDFSRDAAETVCGDDTNVAATDVGQVLDSLVQKSLVAAQKVGRTMRYRLLETIRHFARPKLVTAGESGPVHDRLAAWVLALVERELSHDAWLVAVGADLANVRAAYAWAVDVPRPDAALRLTTALLDFWLEVGSPTEGRAWALRAIDTPDDVPRRSRALALVALGKLMLAQKAELEARPHLEEAVAILRAVDDPATLAEALHALGEAEASEYVGEVTVGIAHLEEALAVRRSTGDELGAIRVTSTMAHIYDGLGEFTRPLALITQSIEAARQLSAGSVVHNLAIRLASYAIDSGDARLSRSLLEEAVALDDGRGDRGTIARCRLAGVLAWVGEAEAARREWDRAVADTEAVDDWFDRGYLQYNLGLLGHRIDAERAEAMSASSLEICRAAKHGPGIGGNLEALGHHALAEGRDDEAISWFEEALSLERELRSSYDVGDLIETLAGVALERGDALAFETGMRSALSEWVRIDAPARATTCLDALAYAASGKGHHVLAATVLGSSDALRVDAGRPRRNNAEGIGTLIGEIPLVMIHDRLRGDARYEADAAHASRQALGDEDFEALRARGRGLDLSQTVALLDAN